MNSGIYEILNTVNGKRYVGSAVNIRRRFARHKTELNNHKHTNIKLERAWDKYGKQSFKFNILLLCSKENIILYEQLSMAAFRPEYNIALVAGSCFGVTRTLATKIKIGAINRGRKRTPEQCARIAASQSGKKLSIDHRLKMSQNRRGKPLTAAHRTAISLGKTGVKTGPQTRESVEKRVSAARGKKHSAEWNEKIGAANSIALTGKPWSAERRAAFIKRKTLNAK